MTFAFFQSSGSSSVSYDLPKVIKSRLVMISALLTALLGMPQHIPWAVCSVLPVCLSVLWPYSSPPKRRSPLLRTLATTKDWDKDGIQYLKHCYTLCHQVLFTSGLMFSLACFFFCCTQSTSLLLLYSISGLGFPNPNLAEHLCSSWSPNRLKPTLLRPRNLIVLFALIPLETWALSSHGHCSYSNP